MVQSNLEARLRTESTVRFLRVMRKMPRSPAFVVCRIDERNVRVLDQG